MTLGCGEGYYTDRLQKETGAEIFGVDISKEAVKTAARKNKDIGFIVGSGARLPFENESFEALLCMFSKIFSGEYSRVLKAEGHLLIVSSGKHHLLELRELLYDNVWIDEVDLDGETGGEFQLVQMEELEYKVDIENNEDLMNLVRMTPYYYKVKKDRIEALGNLDGFKRAYC